MPRGDKTGPEGFGQMTGQQLGYCTSNNRPGFMEQNRIQSRGFGRGFQFGSGRGRGRGYGFRHGAGTVNLENTYQASEKTLIENEIRILKDQLSFLEEKLSKTKEE